jgi:hypothetical protein
MLPFKIHLQLLLSSMSFMKRIALAFVTISLSVAALAQDCSIKRKVDPFSKETRLSSGFIPLTFDKGTLSLTIEADSKEIRFLFSLKDGSCFDDQSMAQISFDGSKTKSSQHNGSSMNCDGIFTIIYRNSTTTPSALEKMTKQQISSIQLVGTSKEKIDISLKPEEKATLMKKIECIVREAKTLIAPAS